MSKYAPRATGGQRGGPASIILAPTAAGCPRAPELAQGPAAVVPLLDVGRRDVDWLDTERLPVSGVVTAVAAAAAHVAASGQVPLIVGGDHTVAAGGVSGVARALRARARKSGRKANAPAASGASAGPPLFLLWLDAHPDVNTAATSPSGNLHGMVLSGLLGEGPLAVDEPLPAERAVLAGVRAFDPGEPAFLQARPQLAVWDVEDLRGDGWRTSLDALLRRVTAQGARLYVSVDLDVFDPTVAPGVVAPAPGGALAEPVVELLRCVRRSGRLAGADVVELYPPLDHGSTAALAARVVEALADVGARSALEEERGVSARHSGAAAAS